MWEWTQTYEALPGRHSLRWGFTNAVGGASSLPYRSLNLGDHVGDDPASVAENRAAVASDLGLPPDQLRFMKQVHEAQVAVVEGTSGLTPVADAMVTHSTGVALAVLVADCVPVLLADRAIGVIGVAHAGRPGLVAGVVPQTVRTMRGLGARRIEAVVGPSVCGRCYEVPAAMQAAVAAVSPVSATVSWTGSPAVDVAAGVVEQLNSLGVDVSWRPGCTRESTNLYSYRRDAVTGRFAGVVLQGGE
ncbi:peptidoglycan editing factor PgeF [Austwickia chelonae]|uniref:peptidoglycan editing factor PgeF n=1 Tax=Austwickia chelonae TaxID=100225 RepID=UPI000E269BD6|nr:peptidoglycan editing factor PgeF [Austwickia chelonae]